MTTHYSFAEHLFEVALTGSVADVKRLIANNPDQRDYAGSALGWACGHNIPELVEVLMDVSDCTAYENRALNAAVEQGHIECAQLLWARSNVNLLHTTVPIASQLGQEEMLRWILQQDQYSTRTIAQGLATLSLTSPNREIFTLLYQHGGRDALEQVESWRAGRECFAHWANECDALALRNRLEPHTSVSVGHQRKKL